MVRKVVFGGLAASLAVSVTFATGALAGGNGAMKSSLGPVSGSTTCSPSRGSNGWAILNAPGAPGAATFVNGEVHLVGAPPGTTYMIEIGMSSGNACTPTMDMLTTNGQGIGNGHIDVPMMTGGTYFVALFDTAGSEQYASSPVTVS